MGNPVTGSLTNLIFKKTTAFGTAIAASTLDKHAVQSYDVSESVEELDGNNLGSGLVMQTTVDRGNVTYSGSITMVVGFQNGADKILAQFMGTPTISAEQTVGQGDFLHTLTLNTDDAANGWLTIASNLTTTETEEVPSAAFTSLTFSHANPVANLVMSAAFVGDKAELASAVNTPAVVAAATLSDQKLVRAATDSEFWLGTEASGALTSANRLSITNYNLSLTRPLKVSNEVRGVLGAGAPISDGFVNGEMQITMSRLAAITYFTAADAGTTFKAEYTIKGAQIGTGTNRQFKTRLPRLKLISRPEYALSDAGNNPVTLTFKVLAADTAPTGFTSVYPQFQITNTKAVVY